MQIKDKCFAPFIKEERILREVKRVAEEISQDLVAKNPILSPNISKNHKTTYQKFGKCRYPLLCKESLAKLESKMVLPKGGC